MPRRRSGRSRGRPDLRVEGDQGVDVRLGPIPSPNRSTAASSSRGMPAKSRDPSRKRATATSSAAMSAADAHGRRRPRGRCAAREPVEIRRAEVEPRRRRSGRAAGPVRSAVGIGHGVLDRKSHIRGAQLGLEGAVDEADGRVDDALGMDDHLDRVVVDIVQPVGLDDLQALVRERGRVDRDLLRPSSRSGAGAPLGRDGREVRGPVEERSARGGQDQRRRPPPSIRRRGTARSPSARSRSAGATPAGSRTDRRGRSRSCSRRPADAPPASPGGRRRPASPCWPSPRPCPRANAARTGRRLTIPDVATTTRSTSSRLASSTRASSDGADDREVAGAVGLLVERRPVRTGGQGDDAESSGSASDIDHLAADRPGRAEERDVRCGSVDDGDDIQRHDGCGEQERIDSVEHPAVARDQRARVLGAGGALEHRLGQVAGLRREGRRAARGAAHGRGAWPSPARTSPTTRVVARLRRRGRRTSSKARCG